MGGRDLGSSLGRVPREFLKTGSQILVNQRQLIMMKESLSLSPFYMQYFLYFTKLFVNFLVLF